MADDRSTDTPGGSLAAEWDRLAADLGLDPQAGAALGDELIARWSEPHRRYHDRRHLAQVLVALSDLASPAAPGPEVRAAAWFHDAIYEGRAGDDEEASASLAAQRLVAAGVDGARADRVAALVRATAGHLDPSRDAPADPDTDLLLDADLSILAAAPADYDRYVRAVREEHPGIDDAAFRTGRTRAVQALLAREPLFRTTAGRTVLEPAARANLTAELDRLTAGRGG
ncbi:HD domain-containing protein [Actinomarinicola tropica]|uniref:Metal-dependent phosphohydrolase n=1 Tax=Actinomarinicola tropica TaxID=2789776 RepID=A0A5Q2RUF4_9ACTN|nr:metal-dependent phosphohydrolase [Actinomarinicola tropica]QGG96845.1 metal-dependent phosphohydrolase [Actinomarinicola tropica]